MRDELATPGYAVLAPGHTKTKLATLAKGQLMVRHPHFTQPIFVSFPRPAVMRGRDGAERYPQAAESTFEQGSAAHPAHARSGDHARLGAGLVTFHDEKDVTRARIRAPQAKPRDVKGFFLGCSGRCFAHRWPARPLAIPLRPHGDDPYAG